MLPVWGPQTGRCGIWPQMAYLWGATLDDASSTQHFYTQWETCSWGSQGVLGGFRGECEKTNMRGPGLFAREPRRSKYSLLPNVKNGLWFVLSISTNIIVGQPFVVVNVSRRGASPNTLTGQCFLSHLRDYHHFSIRSIRGYHQLSCKPVVDGSNVGRLPWLSRTLKDSVSLKALI